MRRILNSTSTARCTRQPVKHVSVISRQLRAVSLPLQSRRHIPARGGSAVSPLLHRASEMPLIMSLFVNELMQNLSMSSAKIRQKKAVHCTHNDRRPACPQMSRVSHVKNVCAQSSTDLYLLGLQLTMTWAQSGVLMNGQRGP